MRAFRTTDSMARLTFHKTVVQEKTVYKTQYVEPITLKTGDNLTFLGVLVGLCTAGFAGTIIFGKKRSK